MISVFVEILTFLTGFRKDRSGGLLIYTALALPALLGAAGLSTDVVLWYLQKRAVQTATDSAAISGAYELARTGGTTAVAQAIENGATVNGYDSSAGDALTYHAPPSSGAFAGDGDAVEVFIERPVRTFFTSLFLNGSVAVAARAVAAIDLLDTCVWVLDPTTSSALKVAGGARVALGCGIMVNSTDPQALTQSGTTSCLVATSMKVAGGYSGDCIQPGPITGVSPRPDPLAALDPPPHGGCDHTGKIQVGAGQTVTLSPGVYCGSIEAVEDGVINFEPGLYVLDGAGLKVSGQGTLTGDGVTFYLTENSGASDNISVQAGATVSLKAAASGDLAGILFYQDRDGPTNVTHHFTGGSNMDIEGILYFPSQDVNFSGGTTLDVSASLIIANRLNFTGQSTLGNLEGSVVETSPYLVFARLVE